MTLRLFPLIGVIDCSEESIVLGKFALIGMSGRTCPFCPLTWMTQRDGRCLSRTVLLAGLAARHLDQSTRLVAGREGFSPRDLTGAVLSGGEFLEAETVLLVAGGVPVAPDGGRRTIRGG